MIEEIKRILKRHEQLWRFILALRKYILIFFRPVNKIYAGKYIGRFVEYHKLDNQYILFASGNTGDIFFYASLIESFGAKYGAATVIAPDYHSNIFRMMTSRTDTNFVFMTDHQISRMRNAIYLDGSYQKVGLTKGVVRPLHVVLYKNLFELMLDGMLSGRDAIAWIIGLNKYTPYRYVTYNEEDRRAAVTILKAAEPDFENIVLINPICYTHGGLSISSWKGVAEAFSAHGYKPVFNLKGNANLSKAENLTPPEYPIVEIPAYLVPVCADIVSLVCSRQGGGFDLLYAFNQKLSNTFLISLSPEAKRLSNEKYDTPYSDIKAFYKEHSGKDIAYTVLLNSSDNEQEAFEKVSAAFKNSMALN